MPTLPPVPNTPLRDDPTQDSIWKRWFQLLKQNYAGLGTVTSVAQTVPAEFTVAGSPITTSGTLAITKATQVQKTFWAGPTSGADAQPTFRTIATADLPAGTGTVTSVASNFTGGLISVAGSPITTSGTLAFTVAGTSGGIPYFSGATTWASSTALAASAIVLGGGAGNPPATTTTGTGVVTALGVNVGTAGSFVVNGGALGTPSSGTVTNLTGTASININGTVGATTPTTGAFTSITATSETINTGGLTIATSGTNQLKVGTSTSSAGATVGAVFYLNSASGSSFQLTAGTGGGGALNGAQGGGFGVYTHTGAVGSETFAQQANFNHVASTTNIITFAGSNGGAPVVATNGGNLSIAPSGNVVCGGTDDLISSADKLSVYGRTSSKTTAAATTTIVAWNSDTAGDNNFMNFGTEASFTSRGSITYNRGAGLVAYNVTSDERAKDVNGIYADSGKAIDAVPVYLGRMKGATLDMPMMIAHELQAVAPYAVTGERGGKEMQQVSYATLVPLMWAEIQSLRSRIATLEKR